MNFFLMLVIKQIGLPLRDRPILLIARMITDRIGRHSALLLLQILDIITTDGNWTLPNSLTFMP